MNIAEQAVVVSFDYVDMLKLLAVLHQHNVVFTEALCLSVQCLWL
jgi:hypothetical protein